MKNLFCKIATGLVLAVSMYLPNTFAQVDNPGQLNGSDTVNTVFTAIPFLRINPDGRTGGMGDVGIASPVDAAALYHNGSKLAFAEQDASLTLTYTPWLKELVNDIYIAYLAGYKKIDDVQTIAGSLRYFSLGEINFTDITGGANGTYSPNELVLDLGYARKLSDNFSGGITLKYVRSDLANGQNISAGNNAKAANALAADVSFFYKNDAVKFGDTDAEVAFGAAITNIGNKVSYNELEETRDFIPINLGIGSNVKVLIDEYNDINISFDMNKLLVPSPDPNATEENDPRDKPLLSGMFGSFNDAPNGLKEEMQEIMFSIGAEYWYNNQFAVRVGHFNEHRLKGNRKYITLGLGLKYSIFGLNFSYIIPATNQRNPLDNTLRFSLNFDLDGAAEE